MPDKKKKNKISAYGLRLLLSNHPQIRKLKRKYTPSVHGNKLWSTSWLLIDYLRQNKLPPGLNVLEVGCGWGLTGIYCAKKCNSSVTAVDIDPDIYPFLELHAKENKVKIEFLNIGFDKIRSRLLKDVNVLIASDICFWDDLVDPLRRLVQRARRSCVDQILIADPGRPTFDNMIDRLMPRKGIEVLDRQINKPYHASGKILKIRN